MEYTGNAICDYIAEKSLDYYFSVEDTWILVYGNSASIPKILVFANKVEDISDDLTDLERRDAGKALSIAKSLKLPFIFVRFMVNCEVVSVWVQKNSKWNELTYDQLRDLYEDYGVVEAGTPRKPVNQYTSSPYHDWQRKNLGSITVSDFDLIKFSDGEVREIVELKRSKIDLENWSPFRNDNPNFALLINTIVGSGKEISFKLYYNLLIEGQKGKRVDDISKIKVFDFIIPNHMISSEQVQFKFRKYSTLEQLLR